MLQHVRLSILGLSFVPCFYLPLYTQNTTDGVAVVVKQAEMEIQSAFIEADKHLLIGNYKKAIETYSKFTYDNPDIDAGWFNLAKAYEATGEITLALEAIRKAIALAPDNKWHQVFENNLLEKSARYKEIIANLIILSRKEPRNRHHLTEMIRIYLLDDAPRQALKTIEKLEILTGITAETALLKHDIYAKLNETDKAVQACKNLIQAFPKSRDYQYILAEYYIEINNPNAAVKVWQEIERLFPQDSRARIQLARYNQTGGSQLELADLDLLIKDTQLPIDEKISAILPFLSETASYQKLLEIGRSLARIHPNNPEVASLLGEIHFQNGNMSAALDAYLTCINLQPRTFNAWERALYLLEKQERYQDLGVWAEKALDAFPNQVSAAIYYGKAALKNGNPQEAQNILEQATLMAPIHTENGIKARIMLSKSLLTMNNTESAGALLKVLIDNGQDGNPEVLDAYGDYLSSIGKNEEAIGYWKKAHAISGDKTTLLKIKEK
jgi:tetratricopeptide (TPR) repeat protein